MDDERRRWYFLVNGLTVTRAILGIGTVVAAAAGDFQAAAVMAGASIVTDFEGRIATNPRIHVDTRLGAIRDLIADQCCYMTAWPAAAAIYAIAQMPEHPVASLAIAGITSLGLAVGLRLLVQEDMQMLADYRRTGRFIRPTHRMM